MRVPAHVWVGVVGVVAGCLPATSHQCVDSDQCGAGGVCEASGACSFSATDCPSGRRYGDGVGPLAGQCVDDGGDDAQGVDAPATDAAGPDGAVVTPWGDRHHGNLTVGISIGRINSYGVLGADAAAGATSITTMRTSGANVGTWNDNFVTGDRVALWRTTGLADTVVSGTTSPTVLDGDVGRWFVTRVTAHNGGGQSQITLADPLPIAFPMMGTQVIKLPELDILTVNTGAALKADDWNGSAGGFTGFFADQLILGGTIDASAAGFRGGNAERIGVIHGCTALDGRSQGGGGAAKGESLVAARYGGSDIASGRGNIHHGGGGGDCHNAGGAGGGGAGTGGSGGHDAVLRPVGGMAGVALDYATATHLAMGGGGGAGDDNDGNAGGGGRGGGVVFVVARTVFCTGGALSAAGGDGGSAGNDGSGGGGGGGLIYVRAENMQGCSLSAVGGDGGDSNSPHGPGGGGGGGRIVTVIGNVDTSSFAVLGGSAGSNGQRGAQNGAIGVIE